MGERQSSGREALSAWLRPWVAWRRSSKLLRLKPLELRRFEPVVEDRRRREVERLEKRLKTVPESEREAERSRRMDSLARRFDRQRAERVQEIYEENLLCALYDEVSRNRAAPALDPRRQPGRESEAHWVEAMKRYRELAVPIHTATLDWWWSKLRVWRREAMQDVLDLSLGPGSWRGSRALPNVVGEVFLTKPFTFKQGKYMREFDGFAETVAFDRKVDGVLCLAGVRGSGKSMILNRIAAVSANPSQKLASESRLAPLVVRLDLSVDFDAGAFARDFIDQVGRAARDYQARGPRAVPVLSSSTLAIGSLGRWCQANIGWALVALTLLLSLIGISDRYAAPKGDESGERSAKALEAIAHKMDAPLAASQPPKPPSEAARAVRLDGGERTLPIIGKYGVADLHLVVLGLVGVVLIGGAHAAKLAWWKRRESQPATTQLEYGRQCLMALLLAGVFAVALTASYDWLLEKLALQHGLQALVDSFGWLVAPLLPADGLKVHELNKWQLLLVPFVVCVLLTVLAIALLPRWWEDHLFFRRVGASTARSSEGVGPDIPHVGKLASQVLPRAEDPEEIEKLSMPFVLGRMKDVLERAAQAFGRVVVLVDDADMLPSEKYHLLLRVLRPISKVRGACCVMAVPTLFYDALHAANLGDLHSSVRECFVLGDPELFESEAGLFQLKQGLSRSLLHKKLVRILVARANPAIDLDTDLTDDDLNGVMNSKFFSDVLSDWGFGDSDEALRDDERLFFARVGTSHREWLRILARPPRNDPNEPTGARVGAFLPNAVAIQAWSRIFQKSKVVQWETESSLNCRPEGSAANGNGAQPPSAPGGTSASLSALPPAQ